MFETRVFREGRAAAGIESQNVLSAQAERGLDDEQLTVDVLRTLFRHVLEHMEDLVTQL